MTQETKPVETGKEEKKAKTEKPFVYDLSWNELFYYIGIEHNGRHRSVMAKMKPYIAGEMVKLLTEREAAFIASSSDADALDLTAPGAPEANREFFDRHMIEIKVEGQVASDKIIEKLDALFKIRPLIIRYGYLNLIEEEPEKTESEFVLEEEFGDTVERTFSFKMADPKDEFKEKEAKARFISRMPTAEDRRVWDQCAKTQALKKSGHRIRYNYSRIEHLANSMIREVPSGFTLKGQKLTDANRDGREGWLELLPYIFKFRLLDSIFTVATEKNE